MKSCLGLLATFLILALVLGGGALIWYLSDTAEFSRSGGPAATSAAPPKAIPVRPTAPASNKPPVAIPVREPVGR